MAPTANPPDEILKLVGALEDASEHPLAHAIAGYARESIPALPAVHDFANHSGRGVSGTVEGHAVKLGRHSWLGEQWP
jgi:Cu+-exporting ATPase